MPGALSFAPLTPDLLDDLGQVLRGSWGRTCWCMYPRLTDAEMKALPGDGPVGMRRRAAMTSLAAKTPAPGLIAYMDKEPVGWIAFAQRDDLHRVARSRATPAFDDVAAWVIPCVTVAKSARGAGIAVALIEAAARYAFENGAPAIEAYPRARGDRVGDDSAFFGAEPMFERAGFVKVRGPLANAPKNWPPRVVMRATPA